MGTDEPRQRRSAGRTIRAAAGAWARGEVAGIRAPDDCVTKTAVAIKVVTDRDAGGWAWQERMGRELRLARQGRHRHVCDVYDFMEADGHRFLTMALATRGTLRETLGRANWPVLGKNVWPTREESFPGWLPCMPTASSIAT